MSNSIVKITSEPVGRGRERACYLHPDDSTKLIKIPVTGDDTQTRREINFYQKLQKRHDIQFTHIPRFYGCVKTSLGDGIVVDLISDADGSVSRSMRWYLNHGMTIQSLEPYLAELKAYLLENLVIINHDLVLGNLLLQKLSPRQCKLVVIDGIGDVVKIQWLNRFPGHVRAKIQRRWERFIKHIYGCPEVTQYLDAQSSQADSKTAGNSGLRDD